MASQFSNSITNEYHNVLNEYNSYFRELDVVNKERFVERTQKFIRNMEFTTHQSFEIKFPMKIIIASAFIQITFGLRRYMLKDYNRIYIAPRTYTYKGLETLKFDGDVNTLTKIISLAWPSVLNGFRIDDDSLNVAIHEFGHCVSLENYERSIFNQFFKMKHWNDWLLHSQQKLLVIRAKENKFLRDYGGISMMELFAVALESFFENPEGFVEHLPNLYDSLRQLLNQDPLNKKTPIRF